MTEKAADRMKAQSGERRGLGLAEIMAQADGE
jgi:hypothetical protein